MSLLDTEMKELCIKLERLMEKKRAQAKARRNKLASKKSIQTHIKEFFGGDKVD